MYLYGLRWLHGYLLLRGGVLHKVLRYHGRLLGWEIGRDVLAKCLHLQS